MRTALTIFSLMCIMMLSAQEEKLEVEGAIQIGNSEDPEPDPGTIRWTGMDFEGWDGSKWVSLTKSNPCGGLTFVQDIDANRYPVVAIGDQCWMAENLKTTKYNDGDPIFYNPDHWAEDQTPAYCWYNNDPDSLGQIYGALYNGFVASDTNEYKVCPIGWHVPSNEEYIELVNNVTFGSWLVESGEVHWVTNFFNDNRTGFTALPGGQRHSFIGYGSLGHRGYWWTSSSDSSIEAGTKYFSLTPGTWGPPGTSGPYNGNSIRCIKDN